MQTKNNSRTTIQKMGFDPDYLAAFEAKLFIQGEQSAQRLTNFFVLLLLATVIATYGLISASTATIIGAMIVAPLMGPIMAATAAVVMGSAERALRSLALVVVGVLCVILLSTLLALIVPNVTISFDQNAELASRISPGLVALLTALASGAAGAYITSREEIADSMGGVAIAISLVPPLCVVGIAITKAEWVAAGGALLLFVTNFLAILLAGGITFLLGGLGRIAVTDDHVRVRRNAFILIAGATILVAIPLSFTTIRVINDALEDRAAIQEVDAWLAGTTHAAVAVDVQDRIVATTIEGYGELPPLRELANRIAASLKRPVAVKLRVVEAQLEPSD